MNQSAILEAGDEVWDPAWSPDGKHIAFVSGRDHNSAIWVMDDDGRNVRRLTENRWMDASPAWSPNGTQIVFERYHDRVGNSAALPGKSATDIFVLALDDGFATQLTIGPEPDAGPIWLPGSNQIAFESYREGNAGIYLIEADGGDIQMLWDETAAIHWPAWSSDGTRIAFVKSTGGLLVLFVMAADGSDVRRIAHIPGARPPLAWSPEGDLIAYSRGFDFGHVIFAVRTDAGDFVQLTDGPAGDTHPTWSPDGEHVAFVSYRDYCYGIFVMDRDGGNIRRLTAPRRHGDRRGP